MDEDEFLGGDNPECPILPIIVTEEAAIRVTCNYPEFYTLGMLKDGIIVEMKLSADQLFYVTNKLAEVYELNCPDTGSEQLDQRSV